MFFSGVVTSCIVQNLLIFPQSSICKMCDWSENKGIAKVAAVCLLSARGNWKGNEGKEWSRWGSQGPWGNCGRSGGGVSVDGGCYTIPLVDGGWYTILYHWWMMGMVDGWWWVVYYTIGGWYTIYHWNRGRGWTTWIQIPSFFLSLSLSFESIGFFDQPISCGAVRGNYSSRFMFCRSKKSQVQHCLMVLSISPPPRAKPCDTCIQGLSYRYWLKLHMRDKHETATAVRNNPWDHCEDQWHNDKWQWCGCVTCVTEWHVTLVTGHFAELWHLRSGGICWWFTL